MRRLRIMTWHVHGNYLLYLTQAHCDFFLPVKPGRPHPYGGRAGAFPWGNNVYEIPAEKIRNQQFDCILFQNRRNYLEDQHEILSESQRRLPRIYMEHDPPWEHPTNAKHIVDDPNVLLVHCTHFNSLMWDSGRSPVRVIEHGVKVPEHVHYSGELERGIVVVNHLARRGRLCGSDIFESVRRQVPLDLVGMAAEELNGCGEISPPDLPEFVSHYRFFFHPIRYTSLGLALVEAMTIGLPIVGLATTELSTVIENGVSGFIDTNLEQLVDRMRELIRHPAMARRLGEAARRRAKERFDIERFTRDWEQTFADVTMNRRRSFIESSTISARAATTRVPASVKLGEIV